LTSSITLPISVLIVSTPLAPFSAEGQTDRRTYGSFAKYPRHILVTGHNELTQTELHEEVDSFSVHKFLTSFTAVGLSAKQYAGIYITHVSIFFTFVGAGIAVALAYPGYATGS